MNNTMSSLDARVIAHRYLYYVKNKPVISDSEYDSMNKRAKLVSGFYSLVRLPQKDNPKDYPQDVIDLAGWLLDKDGILE